MSKFEDFWLRVGDSINISTPPEGRSPAVRRALAVSAFERWRVGKLDITSYFESEDSDTRADGAG
jgi:hypothetical protein